MGNNEYHEFEANKEFQCITYVLFMDNWCSLCRDVKYILDELRGMSLPTYIVDIAENPELISKYSIVEIPTVIIFRKGRIAGFIEGKHPRDKYLAFA